MSARSRSRKRPCEIREFAVRMTNLLECVSSTAEELDRFSQDLERIYRMSGKRDLSRETLRDLRRGLDYLSKSLKWVLEACLGHAVDYR